MSELHIEVFDALKSVCPVQVRQAPKMVRNAMKNIYKLKHGMQSDYLRRKLRRLPVRMAMN